MARTLILNVSATAQTLPAAYGGGSVASGYGWVVADESSVAVTALGGFEAMDGKWAVSAISTDTALGTLDVAANGVALIAAYSGGGGGGGGGPVAWNDVTGKPAFSSVATSGSYADLINKPALADVATSGDYDDLANTPTLPAASNTAPAAVSTTGAAGVASTYARGDHQHAHGNQAGGALHSVATTIAAGFMSAADKSKLDGLATVAISGSYTDLSGKPTLATVATSGSYSDLTGTPELSMVAQSGSYEDLSATPNLAAVATTGAYADLTGKPSLAAVATSGAYSDLSGKPSLANVATSGDYNDLTNLPILSFSTFSGSYTDLTNKPTAAYDIASYAPGSLALSAVTMKFYAPKALTLTALNQGGGATIKVQVAGADITYPKSVTAGQLITTVVTSAGTDNYFTISAVEA